MVILSVMHHCQSPLDSISFMKVHFPSIKHLEYKKKFQYGTATLISPINYIHFHTSLQNWNNNPNYEAINQVPFCFESIIRAINTPVSKPFLSSETLPPGDSDLMLSATLPVLPRGLPVLSHNSCINKMVISWLIKP
jgi:hypothetical protein